MTSKQACLILAAIAATGGVAQARPMHVVTESDGTTAVRVQTSDVDLASDGGARTMWVRLQEAAHVDCGQTPSLANLDETAAYKDCLNATERDAVSRLGSQKVAAVSGLYPPVLLASR